MSLIKSNSFFLLVRLKRATNLYYHIFKKINLCVISIGNHKSTENHELKYPVLTCSRCQAFGRVGRSTTSLPDDTSSSLWQGAVLTCDVPPIPWRGGQHCHISHHLPILPGPLAIDPAQPNPRIVECTDLLQIKLLKRPICLRCWKISLIYPIELLTKHACIFVVNN